MGSWFGTPFDPATHKAALEEAMRRRGVAGIRIWLARGGGLGVDTSSVRGRGKAAARERSRAFGAFLNIEAELACRRHQPSDHVQCDSCLCWFRGDEHACRGPCCSSASPTASGVCEIAIYRDRDPGVGGHRRRITGEPGTLPHRWRPRRCDGCSNVFATDLDDLRAQLRAAAP